MSANDDYTDDDLTLEAFATEVVECLADFVTYWRRNKAADNDDQVWPDTMRPADWWEQFTQHDPSDQ